MADSAQPQRADEQTVTEGAAVALDPLATTTTRLQALLALGLDVEELSLAVDVTPATVRNWLKGTATPRRGAVRTVDDLRQVALVLTNADLGGPDVAQWLRSRQGGVLESDRPIDVIAEDPARVLAAAHGLALEREEREERKAGLRVVAD